MTPTERKSGVGVTHRKSMRLKEMSAGTGDTVKGKQPAAQKTRTRTTSQATTTQQITCLVLRLHSFASILVLILTLGRADLGGCFRILTPVRLPGHSNVARVCSRQGAETKVRMMIKGTFLKAEIAEDNRAQVYPTDVNIVHKSCNTRYGQMAYRTIQRVSSQTKEEARDVNVRAATAHELACQMSAMLDEQGETTPTSDLLRFSAICENLFEQRGLLDKNSCSHGPLDLPNLDVIFVHGLGTDGNNCQPPACAVGVNGRRWIVPDLIGHGRSDVSADIFAYKMESQALAIFEILLREGTRRCAVIAHSMGGPIAVNLVELCASAGIRVELILYCEGNLDEGDCYHARALAGNVIHKELWVSDIIHRRSAVLYWSACWLIKASSSQTLLPRLTSLARPPQALNTQHPPTPSSQQQKNPPTQQLGGALPLDVRFLYGDKLMSGTGTIERV